MTRTRLGLALSAVFAAGTLFYPAIIQAQGLGVSSARDIPDEVQKAQPRVDQVIEPARPFLAGENGLTPPPPYDNLPTQVAEFKP